LAGQRLFLEAVQDQFHPRRNPELVEYLEQIISDCLLARGWKSGAVALASYAATLFLAAIGLTTVGRRGAMLTAFLIAGAIAATLAGIDRFRARSPGKQRSNAHAGGEFLASK
jgi:hypothetical protein